ncbi:hypothetical protein ABT095_11290 [Kitasatospora sp. NPDC002227]|uniref:hypothetical protein n=1 Tax=Kitasatospora sp. NPDC002227 TaxID=3154773 RepID=UPI0033344052
MLLPREKAHFVLAGTPLLLLDGAPVHESLPLLHAPDGEMPLCPGWSVAAMATMCVVDGPGDAGCLIPALGTSESDPATALASLADWSSAVERTGGAVVVSLPSLPENLAELDWPSILTGGGAHGGFVPTARP